MSTLPRPLCIPPDAWERLPRHVAQVVAQALAMGLQQPDCAATLQLVPPLCADDIKHLPEDTPEPVCAAERLRLRHEIAGQAASFMRALAFFLTVRRAL